MKKREIVTNCRSTWEENKKLLEDEEASKETIKEEIYEEN